MGMMIVLGWVSSSFCRVLLSLSFWMDGWVGLDLPDGVVVSFLEASPATSGCCVLAADEAWVCESAIFFAFLFPLIGSFAHVVAKNYIATLKIANGANFGESWHGFGGLSSLLECCFALDVIITSL